MWEFGLERRGLVMVALNVLRCGWKESELMQRYENQTYWSSIVENLPHFLIELRVIELS